MKIRWWTCYIIIRIKIQPYLKILSLTYFTITPFTEGFFFQHLLKDCMNKRTSVESLLDRLFWHVFTYVLYSSLLKGKSHFVPLAVLRKIINLLLSGGKMAREVELFKSSLTGSQPLFLTSSEPKSNTPPHNLRPLKGRRHFVRAVSKQ